jgi:branched-chain amino acid aminotransferase
MKSYYNHNGKLFEASENSVSISNHSYRYGDGLFETMKLVNGNIPLADYHFERLFEGMKLLGFKIPGLFTKEKLLIEIKQLAEKNNCSNLARVRLSVSRGNGGVNDCDDHLQYTIECTGADENINRLNENGFVIDIFPDAVKSCDKFSNLKSSNYLSYVMAAKFARENKLNDAIILNQYGRICEASIANLFWIKDKAFFTPPLSEGCVAGVMRKFLIEKIKNATSQIKEKTLTKEVLLDADELFLTNAVFGMRWVRQLKNKHYRYEQCTQIFQSFISPLWK